MGFPSGILIPMGAFLHIARRSKRAINPLASQIVPLVRYILPDARNAEGGDLEVSSDLLGEVMLEIPRVLFPCN